MLDNVGLLHMNGRVLDPILGRFLSVDPLIGDLADSQAANPYTYVGNRALSFTDPSGLQALPLPPLGPISVLGSILLTAQNFLPGSAKPPPPPAIALPGQSAQNGIGQCGPGNTTLSCAGVVLYAGVPGAASGGPSSSWVTGADPDDTLPGNFPGETGAASANVGLVLARDQNIPTWVKLGAPIVVAVGTGGVLLCISNTLLCAAMVPSAELALAPSSHVPLLGGSVVGRAATAATAARAIDPNRLHHIFGKAEHALDDFVRASGGREQAFKRIQEAANAALREGKLVPGPNGILPSGNAGPIINVGGTQIRLIGGRAVDGVVDIASATRRGLP
jgi:RHS repeat-associated protein